MISIASKCCAIKTLNVFLRIIVELVTKKKSRRKIWTREWLLKQNERGAYNGILNELRLNEF